MPVKSYKMIMVKMFPKCHIMMMVAAPLIFSVSGSCKLHCSSSWVDDCDICHTIHYRECTITMKSVMVPRKIKKCSQSKLSVLDGIDCKDGNRMRCKVR